MDQVQERTPVRRPDWDALYREGTPVWDTGLPAAELMGVVDEGLVPRGTVLELGCGTGATAIFLAKRGFEVTAVDSAPTAIERARVRADREDTLPRFVLADVFEFGLTAGQFDFIYDAGFYHFARQTDLDRYLDLLWRVTRPSSLYLTLAGARGETAEGGPPQVSKRQLYSELARLFEMVRLRHCRLESPLRPEGYLAWSCLMQRPPRGK
jgi:SAM-dependent methyltransferase